MYGSNSKDFKEMTAFCGRKTIFIFKKILRFFKVTPSLKAKGSLKWLLAKASNKEATAFCGRIVII